MTSERRTLTVLFCDVVSSTAMAEQLDPEEWTEIMNRAFQHLTAPISRYDGTVSRLLGDAVLALFGAPVAHEDDPERAVLAALDMLVGIAPFREQVSREYGMDFNVRIGINTGPVVVGDVGSAAATEYTAMGDAVNVAARMEQTAQPGTIQVAGDTHRLVAPLFDFESLGEIDVKGKINPAPAYQVLGAKAQPGPRRGIEGVSAPLIGRDREFTQLKEALEQVRQGRGQIVCLIGEAGLGKSRLLEELHGEWIRQSVPESWSLGEAVAYESSRLYGLFQRYARGMFGVELDDSADVIHRKVDTTLHALGMSEEAVALCSASMERVIAAKVLHDAPDYPADTLKQDIFDTTYGSLRLEAAANPTVMVFDDLQWADQPSVDLLIHFLQLTEEVPILFVCAFRPERESPAWQVKLTAETNYPHRYTEVVLQPLGEEEADDLVSALLSISDLPPQLRHLIASKAEGNPYFVEEVVRRLIDDGVLYHTDDGLRWTARSSVEDIDIPDSLQGLLLARIDRLEGDVRATLQLAAVIGRSFYYRILDAISDSAVAVDRHMSTLQRVELVREASRLPELEYIFKHELARDAAYSSILRRTRREQHRHVGEAIEALFPDNLERNAHRLAYHFAEAGDDGRAVRYYTMAAESATEIYANAEAAAHYGRAIEFAERAGVTGEKLSELRERQAAMLELKAS